MDVAERERKEAEAELERRLAGSFETAALVRREQAVREAEQEAAVEAEAEDTFLRAEAKVAEAKYKAQVAAAAMKIPTTTTKATNMARPASAPAKAAAVEEGRVQAALSLIHI